VLGKRLVYKAGGSETKANPAVQAATEFIEHDKAIMICGGTSSAVVIALAKLAQREKVLFMSGASGSNDTAGKDCQRYCFRSQPSAYMDAKALTPVLSKELGPEHKAVYLVPDYTYGTALYDSMKQFTEKIGWTIVSHYLAPVGTTACSAWSTLPTAPSSWSARTPGTSRTRTRGRLSSPCSPARSWRSPPEPRPPRCSA
jgi:branched-chain amino acid transport system substrate-binding protein